jgi:Fe-S-cluster containining protein
MALLITENICKIITEVTMKIYSTRRPVPLICDCGIVVARNLLPQRKCILLTIDTTSKPSPPIDCNCCGSCCRNFPYILLSTDDIKALETYTGLSREKFTYSIDKAGLKRFMKFNKIGDCVFLNSINGVFSCGVYEARSSTCREYPSTGIQIETCRTWSGR